MQFTGPHSAILASVHLPTKPQSPCAASASSTTPCLAHCPHRVKQKRSCKPAFAILPVFPPNARVQVQAEVEGRVADKADPIV